MTVGEHILEKYLQIDFDKNIEYLQIWLVPEVWLGMEITCIGISEPIGIGSYLLYIRT